MKRKIKQGAMLKREEVVVQSQALSHISPYQTISNKKVIVLSSLLSGGPH